MRPFGNDRVRVADDGRVFLSSRIAKGWQPRVPKTLTRSEHPGTAVLWEEEYYEVVDVGMLPQGGYRYVLTRWRDEHAMRLVDRYDEESEALRLEEHRASLARETKRKTANALGMLTGHLPARVQEHLGHELGVLPHRLTLLSLLPTMALMILILGYHIHRYMYDPPTPFWTVPLVMFLGFEVTFRGFIAFQLKRPIGSVIGLFAYLIYYAFAPKSLAPVDPLQYPKGEAVVITETPEKLKLRDELTMRGALITLLPAAEQQRVAERFEYDYREHAPGLAWLILVGAILGVVTSGITLRKQITVSALTSLLLAATLMVEQVWRIYMLQSRPIGSILAPLARPFVKRFLT